MNAPVSMSLAATLLAIYGWIAMWRAAEYGVPFRARAGTFALPAAAAIAVNAVTSGNDGSCWIRASILACVAISSATDAQTGYVFDAVLLATIGVLLPASIASGQLWQGVWGAFAGGVLPLVAYCSSRGRWIGLGDVKLAGVVGLALGSEGALICLWVACVSGGCIALWMLATKRAGRSAELRFAPFLALGTYAALLLGRAA
jgi:prepilin signal peptidase PulO-like enzyme (type II secretory pathway)